VVREDAYDYALADRSGGPAPEDRRLGLLARWAGLLHVNQVTEALNAMKRAAASGRTVRPIGDLLIENKWLDEARLSALLRVSATPRDAQAERLFCDVAVQNKFLRPELAEAALADQAGLQRNGQQAPFVGFLLIEKEYMAEPHVAAILKAQDRRGKGLLPEVRQALAASPGRGAAAGAEPGRRTWRRSPVVAAAAVVVIVVALIQMRRFTSGPSPPRGRGEVICEKCGRTGVIRLRGEGPYACPHCGEREAWWAVRCRKCKLKFPCKRPGGDPPPCPRCRDTRVAGAGERPPEDAKP
jgi:hypothetical protein